MAYSYSYKMLRRLSLIFGYMLAAAVIAGGTALLIAYGNGYSYDFKTGTLKHKGLVILESLPSGAKITVDGREIKPKTPYRNTYEGGLHDFTVSKDGYRTWHKQVPVTAAQVSLVQYVILLPQHIQVSAVVNRSAIDQLSASRDRRRLAYTVPSGPDAGLWWTDTNSRSQTKIYTPAAPEGQAPESIQLLGWSDDASHLLIRTQIGTSAAYRVISANPSDQPINLTETFKVDLTGVTFSPNDWREMYWLDNGSLRRLNSGAQTISAVLAGNVLSYAYAGDRIIYVDGSAPAASLWSLDRGGRKQQLVSELSPGRRFALDYATYIGSAEVAVLNLDSGRPALYNNVFGDKIKRTDLEMTAESVKFNGDGRFLLGASQAGMSTYDVERGRVYKFSSINTGVTGVNWYDNYHVLFNRGGQIVLSEFDGNYSVVITKAGPLPAFASADGRNVLTVGQNSSGESQLRAVKIRP